MDDIRAASDGSQTDFASSVESALYRRRMTAYEQSRTDTKYTKKTQKEIDNPEYLEDYVDEEGVLFEGNLGSFKFEQLGPKKAMTTSRAEFKNFLDHSVASQWYYDGIKPSVSAAMEKLNMLIGERSTTAPLADEFAAKQALKNAESIIKDVFVSNPIWGQMHGFSTLSPEMRATQLGDWFASKFGADGPHVEKLFNVVLSNESMAKNPAKFNRTVAELYSNWKLGNLGTEEFKAPKGLEQLYLDAKNVLSGRRPSLKRSEHLPLLNVRETNAPSTPMGAGKKSGSIAEDVIKLIDDNEAPADKSKKWPYNNTYKIEGCTVELTDADGVLFLENISADNGIGKGAGTRAMTKLTEYADTLGAPMELKAQPFPNPKDRDSMGLIDLVTFYEKFGFEAVEEEGGYVIMKREARTPTSPPESAPKSGIPSGETVAPKPEQVKEPTTQSSATLKVKKKQALPSENFMNDVTGGANNFAEEIDGNKFRLVPQKWGDIVEIHPLSMADSPKYIEVLSEAADKNGVTLKAQFKGPKGAIKETPKPIKIDTSKFTKNAKASGLVDDVVNGNSVGATFNNDGTEYNAGGLVVPIRSVDNITAAELTPERIAEFLNEKNEFISSDKFRVGIYHFDGQDRYSIDLNLLVDQSDKQLAMDIAKWCKQKAVFDMAVKDDILTGLSGENTVKLTAEQSRILAAAVENGELPGFMNPKNVIDNYVANGFRAHQTPDGTIKLIRNPQIGD